MHSDMEARLPRAGCDTGHFFLIWAAAKMLPHPVVPESQQVMVTVCLPYLYLTSKPLCLEYLMHNGDYKSLMKTPLCRELGDLPVYVPHRLFTVLSYGQLGEGV